MQKTEMAVSVKNQKSRQTSASESSCKRQLEYLAFIAKYIHRFGRAPAESDTERHFLVSAPSVNQMMQMIERRGFITRQAGVPRSTRISIDLAAQPWP
ncbi:MAG: MarR family transcriptional regulator [Rhodoferax sp.]|nr:MarR family transcriptional regulator [Rhodoferax sp.]